MEPIKKLFQAKVFYKYGEKKLELDSLQDQFLRNIPNQIRPHVKVKDRIGQMLLIEVLSNSIAHKIKMTSSTILTKMNKHSLLKLKKIKIKIAIENPEPRMTVNKISIASINQMKRLSNKIDNSPLKIYLTEIFKNK